MPFPWIYLLPLAGVAYLLWNRRSAATADVKAMLAGGAQVVDVRTMAEFNTSSHPRAVNIPLDELDRRVQELDSHRPVLVCCETGSRSGFAAALLRRKGFQQVANIGPWRRIQSLLA